MSKLKVEAQPDFQAEIMASLRRIMPRKDGDGKTPVASFELSRSNEQVLSEIKYVLTTGIRAFDDLVGGFPFGRVCEVYGMESSGKTALVIRTAIRAQLCEIFEIERDKDNTASYTKVKKKEADIAVLYIDNEQSIDDDTKLIVDDCAADVILCRADTVDLMFKIIDRTIQVAEERERAYQASGVDKKVFLVIIVDTIAATSSRQELEMEWGKEDYPRQAAQISRGFRRLVRDVNRHNVCMVCTNQVRDNVKDSGQNSRQNSRRPKSPTPQDIEYTTFGGKALRYYASHRIFIYKLPAKYRLVPDARFAAGFLLGFQTTKNRLRKPLREGRMALLFDEEIGGLNDSFSVLETLLLFRFAEIENKETGTNIRFKLSRHQIQATTFEQAEVAPSLAEQDEKPVPRRKPRKDPVIRSRAEWLPFYEVHRADIDQLWTAAIQYAFETEGLNDALAVEEYESENREDEVTELLES